MRDVYVRDGATYTNNLVSLSCKFHEPNKCGVVGEDDSTNPVISDDGAVVVFSTTSKFLDLDFNGVEDIFLVERSNLNGEVSKLSRISNNTTRIVAGNGASTKPALSADGRFVAFQSVATNLVASDTNSKADVFVFDRKFNRMVMCSKPTTGTSNQDSTNPDISGGGEYVTFQSTSTSFGISSGVSQAYVGTISRGADGELDSCDIDVASKGSGTGSTLSTTNASIGIVPRSATVNGKLVRTRGSSICYQTASTNISNDSDSNGLTDIFQAPICTDDERNSDTDGDGTSDCFDQCASDPIAVESDDSDADGVPDCEDGCSSDSQKAVPGLCGCGVSDTDSDSDGTVDCDDDCANDPLKTDPGVCGCGIADTDANNNGVADCKDTTGPTPAPSTTPTPAATATPTFDITTFTPDAPSVKRVKGSLKIDVRFSANRVTDPSKVLNYDLIGRRLSVNGQKLKRSTIYRRRNVLDGVLKLPSAGRWTFTTIYNGPTGLKSLESESSRAISVK